jgi:hypothetical protein
LGVVKKSGLSAVFDLISPEMGMNINDRKQIGLWRLDFPQIFRIQGRMPSLLSIQNPL